MSNCGTARDMVKFIRQQLDDKCEPYRYDDQFIMDRISMSMKAVFALRPDFATAKKITIPMIPGTLQKLPDGVAFLEFIGTANKDSSGSIVECTTQKPTQANDEFLSAYAGRCSGSFSTSKLELSPSNPCSGYQVRSYSYEPKNGLFITVSPSAPESVTSSIIILGSECPMCSPESLDEEISCKFSSAIYEKAMAFMYDAESEDAANSANAQRHNANFNSIIGAQYQTDSRIGSGYYLGQKPDGSPDQQVRRG